MGISRRHLLAGLGAAALTGRRDARAASTQYDYISCCKLADGDFAVALLSRKGDLRATLTLPARGHDAAISPDGRSAVVFARRPGRFAIILDLQSGTIVGSFAPPPGRHFYGHGVFSSDGRQLITTENDYEQERGLLGRYEVGTGYRPLPAFDSRGIGPHQVILLRDGQTLAVANGGIATHPDFPRQKLNLATMAPNLTLIDLASGNLVERAALPNVYHQLSLRHLVEAGDASLWIGGQYEGPLAGSPPTVARFQLGRGLQLLDARRDHGRAMKGYIGSLACSRGGERVAMTSPRGGQVTIWDVLTGRQIEAFARPDVCGVAARGAHFLFSTGQGCVHWHQGRNDLSPIQFDNHLRAL
ncbi:MAG: DUF1513 domain-containing protein [Pseudomonadota bacterium]